MNKKNIFALLTLIAALIGFVIGIFVKYYVKTTNEINALIKFPGSILLKVLQLLIIPLILSSLISGNLRN